VFHGLDISIAPFPMEIFLPMPIARILLKNPNAVIPSYTQIINTGIKFELISVIAKTQLAFIRN